MSKSKHTPGPWVLETVTTSCGVCHKIGPFPWRKGKDNHACIYVDDDMGWQHGPELAANAHLIAAAPELIAALKLAIAELRSLDAKTIPDYCDKIVAKAEGKND